MAGAWAVVGKAGMDVGKLAVDRYFKPVVP